jgi:hypothetical protein
VPLQFVSTIFLDVISFADSKYLGVRAIEETLKMQKNNKDRITIYPTTILL